MKKRRSSRRPHFRTPIIALILVVLATVGYLSYRYFFVPQVVSINKLVEEGDGLTFTQTGQRGATAPTTNNNDNKNTKEKNTKEKNTGTCSTNGSPVKAGTWAATGRYIDDKGNVCTDYKTNPNCKGACDQCKAVKGRYYEFDGKDLAKCDKQVATGASVTLPSYANKSYCNGQPSCNSCFAKINGKYIQIGIGQSYQDKKGITQYCNPDGQPSTKLDEEAMKKFCPAGQKWINGKCDVVAVVPAAPVVPNTPQVPTKVLKSAGATVSSASECVSGEASPTGNQNTPTAKYVCIGGKTNDIVDNASQCISNYALSQTNGKVKCVPCAEGMNNDDRTDSSYFTCDSSGKAIFHNCTTGSPTKASGTWSCPPAPTEPVTPTTYNEDSTGINSDYSHEGDGNTPPAPAEPVTPQPPSNPDLTECSGGICPDQPIIDTPPTNNSNLGEESTSETVADVAGGAVTGALILGGIGCGLGIVAGLATGGLGLPLAAAGCVSFLGPAALAGGTIGGILGFFK